MNLNNIETISVSYYMLLRQNAKKKQRRHFNNLKLAKIFKSTSWIQQYRVFKSLPATYIAKGNSQERGKGDGERRQKERLCPYKYCVAWLVSFAVSILNLVLTQGWD